MKKTILVLNELVQAGLVGEYAIGGAMAVTFYAEPAVTYDLDVFVSFPEHAGPIVTLSPIYAFLQTHGYVAEREHVHIEGVPVQFLPAYNALVEEALRSAREVKYGATQTRVFRAEHLLALMLQTYRPKDKTRMLHLLEEAAVDHNDFKGILERHGLDAKWREFRQQFGLA